MSSCSQSVRDHNAGGEPCIYTHVYPCTHTHMRTAVMSQDGLSVRGRNPGGHTLLLPTAHMELLAPISVRAAGLIPRAEGEVQGVGKARTADSLLPISPLATPRWGREMEHLLEADHSLTSRDHRVLYRWVQCYLLTWQQERLERGQEMMGRRHEQNSDTNVTPQALAKILMIFQLMVIFNWTILISILKIS